MIKITHKNQDGEIIHEEFFFNMSEKQYEQHVKDCTEISYKNDLMFFYNMTVEEAENYYKSIRK